MSDDRLAAYQDAAGLLSRMGYVPGLRRHGRRPPHCAERVRSRQ